MHIGITGPISTKQLESLLNFSGGLIPTGMGGIPVNMLIIELHKRGHQLSVFSHSLDVPPGQTIVLRGPNIDVYYSHYRKRARHRVADLYHAERKSALNNIRQARPDIIHAQWQYEWAWAALDSGIPTLVTCQDSPIDILLSMRAAYWAVRLLVATLVLRKAKFLTAVSPYTARRIKQFTNVPISVIPNFEPDSVFAAYQERQLSGKPEIAMINNNFSKRKNVAVAFLAFKELIKSHPKATLHLYGIDFGKGEEAQKWALENNCAENVIFHGAMEFNELITKFSEHTLFLHTAVEESFGMVLVEASALGLPSVGGKNSGGVPWVLEDAGVLVDVTSPGEIREALDKLITDNMYYQEISQRARRNALNRFSAKTVVDQYIAAYEQLR